LRDAIQRFSAVGTVKAVSALYETEPVDVTDQPWFLNCAVELETGCMPRQLLAKLLAIEKAMGRRRTPASNKGPRTIDIDILLFGNSIVNAAGLIIPHPAMHIRRFVLVPLSEIAAEERHPVLQQSVRELRDALPPGQTVRKLGVGPPRNFREQ
jgi:2-amino-4-hydroxy-6-hydroxymethyldihydropteridine diphosphokinase